MKIATSLDDGNNTMGYAVQTIMAEIGIPAPRSNPGAAPTSRAGRRTNASASRLAGKADAVFYEAFMTPYWKNFADSDELNFIPIEDVTCSTVSSAARAGGASSCPPAIRRRIDAPFDTMDFSDFLMIARDDLADDVAYLLAWAMCETKEVLERQYRHIPSERSPVTWPLDPVKIAATSIPLHPGAARYYRNAGVLGKS